MINFILPNFYSNYKFNNLLKRYIRMYPNYLNFNDQINIYGQQGNFPYSFWHGGINTNQDKSIVLYNQAIEYSNNFEMPLIFDYSNIYLSTNNFWIKDPHAKMILSLFENQGNFIKVSDLQTKELIQAEYPGYNFILKDINTNLIKDFSFIELNNDNNVENKNKVLYPLRVKCLKCTLNCLEQENLLQFNFFEESCFKSCSENHSSTLEVLQEYQEARKKGYTNFYFGEVLDNDIINLNQFLMEFFIKKEYQEHFKQEPLL